MVGVSSFLKTFQDIIYVERFSASGGLLQEVDPRVKLACITAFILCAVAVRTLGPLIILFGLVIGLSAISKIPLRFFLLRTAFIPIFAGMIALPLPFITPGMPLAQITWGGLVVSISSTGLYRAALFTLRVLVCVASLVLVVLTTKSSKLFRAMQDLKLPRLLVVMTIVTYRFIFLFINEAYRMTLAKESRTPHKQTWREVLRSLANMMSTLFIRAYERGERVYLAMLARGYSGTLRSLDTKDIGTRDWLFASGSLTICFVALLLEYVHVVS